MGVWRWGKRMNIYLSLHCHRQNDSYIKMGSGRHHFNVSLILTDKVTNETVSTDHTFWRERRAEEDSNRGPSAYQPKALPLGQTGSRSRKICLLPVIVVKVTEVERSAVYRLWLSRLRKSKDLFYTISAVPIFQLVFVLELGQYNPSRSRSCELVECCWILVFQSFFEQLLFAVCFVRQSW